MLPVVANLLRLADESLGLWQEVSKALAKQQSAAAVGEVAPEQLTTARRTAVGNYDAMALEARKIELLGGRRLVQAGEGLTSAYESMRHWLREASPSEDPHERYEEAALQVEAGRSRLIAAARGDMGI